MRLRAFTRFFGRVTGPLAAGGGALDTGCGTGDVVSLLRQAVLGVDAVDLSGSVVRGAARRFSKDGDVRVMVATVDALPFDDAAFSLVTCRTVLQHVIKPARVLRALQELRRVLAPGGRFLLLETEPSMLLGRARRMARVLVLYSMRPLGCVLRVPGPSGLAYYHTYALRSL